MATIERVITRGAFELDGGSWEVDNNIWIVGDDSDVVIFDAAHNAAPILAAVGNRNVVAVVCTHGHNDHVTVAPELSATLDAPVLLHPGDDVLWRMTHPDKDFRSISDEETLNVAGTELRALHTPGHSPGSVCWYAPELDVVFSGDTLFSGCVARRYRCAYGSWRQHYHRRRDHPLRGMGDARPLILFGQSRPRGTEAVIAEHL
jgi:glyoxylase-like metal-dependent hydrolase (beta-lactamase superfamily II)